MTPGLAGPPFASKKAIKGAVVAVASLEAPTVPMAVGTCEIDISALQTTRNAKGCAVEIFHWAGDELWDWSTSGKAGRPPPENIEGWETEEFSAFMARFNGLEVDDKDEADVEGGVPLPGEDNKSSDSRNRHGDQNGLVEVVNLDSLEMTTQGTTSNTTLYAFRMTDPLRNRQSVPFSIFVRRTSTQRQWSTSQIWRRLSSHTIHLHLDSCPSLPTRSYAKASRSIGHQEDQLEERTQVYQISGKGEVTALP